MGSLAISCLNLSRPLLHIATSTAKQIRQVFNVWCLSYILVNQTNHLPPPGTRTGACNVQQALRSLPPVNRRRAPVYLLALFRCDLWRSKNKCFFEENVIPF